jgi:hypothetical protein
MDAYTTTVAPRPSRQRWLLVSLGLFFAILSVQYTFKVKDDGRSAFLRWRPQLLDLGEGVNIYERHNYPNPPIMALLLAPLAQLPPLAGSLAWFFLKAGLTVLAMHWVLLLVEVPGQPFPAWAKGLAVLLSLRPAIGDLTHGNVNLFILFLVVAALYAYTRQRDKSAGLLLALAIACKVTPALFVPYFAWKRAWKTLAGCGAGLVLFFGVVPACFLGVRENNELLGSWLERMVLPYVVGGAVTTEHQNQSLPGVVCRLTTAAASFSQYEGLSYVPTEYHNLVQLPEELAHWLVRGCMAVFAGLLAWACRTPPGSRRSWRLAIELALVTLGMLLFSERTWKHHYVTLILPLAVVLYYLAACRPSPGRRAYLIGTLAVALLLMVSTSTGLPGVSERLGKLAEVYGAYLWANLLLVGALVVLLRCQDGGVQGDSAAVYGVAVRRVVLTAAADRQRQPWPARLSPQRGQGGVGV